MILETFQSLAVLNVLEKGQVYYAKPSISFRGEYGALVDMLKLKCQCPVFTVVKGRKQNIGGRISASVKLVLNVPDNEVKLTEYGVWADFMYCYKFTKPGDYTKLKADCEEVSVRRFQDIMADLKRQKNLSNYKYPQAVLEKIEPNWLVSYRIMGEKRNSALGMLKENVLNIFRK